MSTSATTNKPRSRQRAYKAPQELDVPHIDEDAAERKRVLNVLAQRRYREKKRQRRIKQGETSKTDEVEGLGASSMPALGNEDQTGQSSGDDMRVPQQGSSVADAAAEGDEALLGWSDSISISPLLLDSDAVSDFLTIGTVEAPGFITTSPSEGSNDIDMVPFMFDMPSSTTDGASKTSSDMSFPDTYLLPVHELTLLKALLRISRRIGCTEELWSLTALSPFNQGNATLDSQLPAAWQPTPSQVLIPHHPVLDFLPWPGVRDRIISIFSLPDEARPPNAAGPLALVNFVYDLEDNHEGVRIYGDDPYDPNSWEVGQVFFERWWFIFDREVIRSSDGWRKLRGAPALKLPAAEASLA